MGDNALISMEQWGDKNGAMDKNLICCNSNGAGEGIGEVERGKIKVKQRGDIKQFMILSWRS